MSELIVLLRGINVGQAKQVPMADLRTLLEDAGYGDVRTLLRSGNVILDAGKRTRETVATDASARIEEHFGFPVEVVVRSAKQLQAVVDDNPLQDVADNPARQHVVFLSGTPGAKALRPLLELDARPERLVDAGAELHLWTPDGMTQSVLAKELARAKLGVTITVRNWNTVLKLLQMTA